ncbi:MAG: hypothetical protein WAL30_03655, partial [Candidatus Aquirickettsiella sp.]
NPVRDECASDAGRSRPNDSRVMRTNFGDTTAEIFREHSDSPVSLIKNKRRGRNEKIRACKPYG